MNRPPPGHMVYWRFKAKAPCTWHFGYVTWTDGYDLIRMGCWNGDTMGGYIVAASEIEWKDYH